MVWSAGAGGWVGTGTGYYVHCIVHTPYSYYFLYNLSVFIFSRRSFIGMANGNGIMKSADVWEKIATQIIWFHSITILAYR